ncbi:MAG: hypothetical protein ACKOBJ_02835 [Actinomycetota bacterium]
MKRFLFLLLALTGAAGAWLWWQRRLDAQQQDVWSQVMTPEPEPEPQPPAPAPKPAAKKKAATKAAPAKGAATS